MSRLTLRLCALATLVLCLLSADLLAQPDGPGRGRGQGRGQGRGRGAAPSPFPTHPDSEVQEGVPQGTVHGPFEWRSDIFPGTVRDYAVYVPAQYDADTSACVLVILDGPAKAREWRIPTVLDNLIHQGDMPVTISIFVNHGTVPAANDNAQGRYNRSFEYDGLGDRLPRFLVEEVLPEVEKSWNLSDDPNDRAIAGASSGGIGAFNVAWERPDEFRRVISAIGTFVGLRGANEFPTLIRKMENKPIRVFLQDGSADQNIYAGNWWIANQDMLSALEWSGYDVNHLWGEDGHSSRHSAAIMPDMLRWLWRDYPEPIVPGVPERRRVDVLIPDEDWTLVSSDHQAIAGPAVNATGEVFFTTMRDNVVYRIGLDGDDQPYASDNISANGLAFGPDGLLYSARRASRQVVRYDHEGQEQPFVRGVAANSVMVLHNGNAYVTNRVDKEIVLVTPDGQSRVVDTGIEALGGLTVSTDQTLLWASDEAGQFVYAFQIQPDGSLAYKQEYGYLHLPNGSGDSGAGPMVVDNRGNVYVATTLGIQIMDQLGRVNFIIRNPDGDPIVGLTFGGPDLNTLYAATSRDVFSRRLSATGTVPAREPFQPPRPGL